ncbi:triphosphoribosyl-dephospho-CoA synthase CitG [Lachnospiraceae bacterium OttesenSCG-928-D06]|nr:triphosphoribosyl-dephospho-CoA synthase CitG [Lachnospiraceae bacterium OttesenSCG-928-D06]
MNQSLWKRSSVNKELELVCKIGYMAEEALLEEVYTTPKPGLVDLWSNGAHTDMDVHIFEKSALALRPYFTHMALRGYQCSAASGQLFSEIRKIGITAERIMYQVTGGVNTHKGAIFTLGILCAAAGWCSCINKEIRIEEICRLQLEIVGETLKKEMEQMYVKRPKSNGEENFCRYGTGGIRLEASKGYPLLFQVALPELEKGIAEKREWNLIKLQTLMVLMKQTEDSNIIFRHNQQVLACVQQEAADFVKRGGAYQEGAIEILVKMDRDFIRRNISAGGCADLLAAAIFLWKLKQIFSVHSPTK